MVVNVLNNVNILHYYSVYEHNKQYYIVFVNILYVYYVNIHKYVLLNLGILMCILWYDV